MKRFPLSLFYFDVETPTENFECFNNNKFTLSRVDGLSRAKLINSTTIALKVKFYRNVGLKRVIKHDL